MYVCVCVCLFVYRHIAYHSALFESFLSLHIISHYRLQALFFHEDWSLKPVASLSHRNHKAQNPVRLGLRLIGLRLGIEGFGFRV